jgi:hypothetical protein
VARGLDAGALQDELSVRAPPSKAKGRAFPAESSILKTKPPASQRSDGNAFVSVSGRLWQTSTKKAPRYNRKLWMERRQKAHPLSNHNNTPAASPEDAKRKDRVRHRDGGRFRRLPAKRLWQLTISSSPYQTKFQKACECLEKDKEVLFTFYDFPDQH